MAVSKIKSDKEVVAGSDNLVPVLRALSFSNRSSLLTLHLFSPYRAAQDTETDIKQRAPR